MNKSTFNLLLIVTIALYSLGTLVYLISSKKPKPILSAIDSKCVAESSTSLRGQTEMFDLSSKTEVKSWAYYIRNVNPNVVADSNHDLVIVDVGNKELFTKETVERMKRKSDGSKKKVIAYVSLGEAENYRPYWKKEWNTKQPSWMGRENILWKGNYNIDNILNPDWWKITTGILNQVLSAGYDGILINGVESYISDNTLDSRKAMVQYVVKVASYTRGKKPEFKILVQDGEALTNDRGYSKTIDGIVKQDLVHNWKSNGIVGPKTPITELNKSIEYLKTFMIQGKIVLVVEYVAGDTYKKAKEILDRHGFVGYSAPRQLDTIR